MSDMTQTETYDPKARLHVALTRCEAVARRLAVGLSRLEGILPVPDGPAPALDLVAEERIDAVLFRLNAALSMLIEEIMDEVLLAEVDLYLPYDTSDNMRDLQNCGAILSAEEVLTIRERTWRHHLTWTGDPGDEAVALNALWADGHAVVGILEGLARHIRQMEAFQA